MLHTLPFKFAAVLIGGVLGALFATLCIRFFETTVSQLGYVAACAIFGGIICAVISTGMSQRSDIFRKLGQDAAIQQWFRNLTMPDFTAVSCCANGDGYWADSFEVREKHYVAIITDPRPDAPLHREHIASGTAIVIPDYKIKWDQGNPSGHGWVFIGLGGVVYCYLPPGGV